MLVNEPVVCEKVSCPSLAASASSILHLSSFSSLPPSPPFLLSSLRRASPGPRRTPRHCSPSSPVTTPYRRGHASPSDKHVIFTIFPSHPSLLTSHILFLPFLHHYLLYRVPSCFIILHHLYTTSIIPSLPPLTHPLLPPVTSSSFLLSNVSLSSSSDAYTRRGNDLVLPGVLVSRLLNRNAKCAAIRLPLGLSLGRLNGRLAYNFG